MVLTFIAKVMVYSCFWKESASVSTSQVGKNIIFVSDMIPMEWSQTFCQDFCKKKGEGQMQRERGEEKARKCPSDGQSVGRVYDKVVLPIEGPFLH